MTPERVWRNPQFGPALGVPAGQERSMLLMITAIVVVEAWALGVVLDCTFDGILHALLPIAGTLVIVQLVLGSRRFRTHEVEPGNFPAS